MTKANKNLKNARATSSLSIPSVPVLDLEGFAGIWYELARIPLLIGKDWTGTADNYQKGEKGFWQVVYSGKKGSHTGPDKKIRQKLRIPDPEKPGEMEVSFLPFIWMKYRLVHMSRDRRTMIVTSSTRRYLWLMSRERILPDKEYKALVWKAKDLGFNTSLLVKVDQSGF